MGYSKGTKSRAVERGPTDGVNELARGTETRVGVVGLEEVRFHYHNKYYAFILGNKKTLCHTVRRRFRPHIHCVSAG